MVVVKRNVFWGCIFFLMSLNFSRDTSGNILFLICVPECHYLLATTVESRQSYLSIEISYDYVWEVYSKLLNLLTEYYIFN